MGAHVRPHHLHVGEVRLPSSSPSNSNRPGSFPSYAPSKPSSHSLTLQLQLIFFSLSSRTFTGEGCSGPCTYYQDLGAFDLDRIFQFDWECHRDSGRLTEYEYLHLANGSRPCPRTILQDSATGYSSKMIIS